MTNLKFTLFVDDPYTTGHCLFARVFDYESLMAVHNAIGAGVYGHHSKKRFFLVPLETVRRETQKLEYPGSEIPLCSFEPEFQLYPEGGRKLNPSVSGIFFSPLSFKK